MSAPAVAWICISMVGLGVMLRDHGKPKTGTDSIWIALLAFSIQFSLLYAGGFFSAGCSQ